MSKQKTEDGTTEIKFIGFYWHEIYNEELHFEIDIYVLFIIFFQGF